MKEGMYQLSIPTCLLFYVGLMGLDEAFGIRVH